MSSSIVKLDERIKEGIYENKWGIVRNFIFAFILLFLIVVCLLIIRESPSCDTIGTTSTLCLDNNDCTFDYAINNNQSCTHYNKPNGAACDEDELCFNHSLCTPVCSLCTQGDCPKPECVGPTSCCQGICTVDDDCLTKVQFLTVSWNTTCLDGVCFYQIFNSQKGSEQQCLDLVDGPVKNCLHATVAETAIYNSICYYNFKCAPPTTGQAPEI